MIFAERDFGIGHKDVFAWAKDYVKGQLNADLDERSVKGGGRLEVDAFGLKIARGEPSSLFGRGPDWIHNILLAALKNEGQLMGWIFEC